LIVCIVNGTGAPFMVMQLTAPNPLPAGGTIACFRAGADADRTTRHCRPRDRLERRGVAPSSQSAWRYHRIAVFAEFTIVTEIELFDGLKSVHVGRERAGVLLR
jgi:hypothetical protein